MLLQLPHCLLRPVRLEGKHMRLWEDAKMAASANTIVERIYELSMVGEKINGEQLLKDLVGVVRFEVLRQVEHENDSDLERRTGFNRRAMKRFLTVDPVAKELGNRMKEVQSTSSEEKNQFLEDYAEILAEPIRYGVPIGVDNPSVLGNTTRTDEDGNCVRREELFRANDMDTPEENGFGFKQSNRALSPQSHTNEFLWQENQNAWRSAMALLQKYIRTVEEFLQGEGFGEQAIKNFFAENYPNKGVGKKLPTLPIIREDK